MIGTGKGKMPMAAKGGRGSGGGDDGERMLKKGPWTSEEDEKLLEYIRKYGEGNWNAVQNRTDLLRSGKSCRLRWSNHLRPCLKKGPFSAEEAHLVMKYHSQMGNKWAKMATLLRGRTDNEIKNFWNTRMKRMKRQGLPLYPPDIEQQKRNECNQNHIRESPMTLGTENTAQFGGNRTPFSWVDPLSINFPSNQAFPVVAPPIYDSIPNQHFATQQPLLPFGQQIQRAIPEDLEFQTMFDVTSFSSTVPVHLFSSRNNYMNLQLQQQQTQQIFSPFSMPMELPSSQYLPELAKECDDDPWDKRNSRLLESIFLNTPTYPNGDDPLNIGISPYLPMETGLPPFSIEDLRYADVKPMLPINDCTDSGTKAPKFVPQETHQDLKDLLDDDDNLGRLDYQHNWDNMPGFF